MAPAEHAAIVDRLASRRCTCKRGHDRRTNGQPTRNASGGWFLRCRVCARTWRTDRTRMRQLAGGLVIATGEELTNRQIAARLIVAKRLERFGPSQQSAEGLERRRRAIAARRAVRCRRGHSFTPENIYIDGGRRRCKTCVLERQRQRPLWAASGQARISIAAHDAFYRRQHTQLRDAMIAAHPDKGGTPRAFIAARRALDRFVKDEAAWYAAYNLRPPLRKAAAA